MVDTTLLKAALPSIPVVNQLPGVRKTGGDPSALREVRSVRITGERVRAYARVCGFPVKDTAPVTFPHILAFPLHMAVMTSPQFPFAPIGTVHIANTITAHRPLAVGETLLLQVHASGLRPHRRGTEVDLVAVATVGEETVWEGTSTYLTRGRLPHGAVDAQGPADEQVSSDELEVVPGRVAWRLAADTGRRYAAVSGDHNPIHLYPLTARAFGFRRQIVHGMWSLARCVAAVENRLPDSVVIDAAFRKPVFLPSTVAFGQDIRDDARAPGIAFSLTRPRDGAPHVVGRTRPLPE